MPCYLFAWHAYGTWMPDRPQGYVRHGQGILPSNAAEAERYRTRQKEDAAAFDGAVQRLLIEEAQNAAKFRRFRIHAVATDPTHAHLLVSWSDERPFEAIRRGLRESLARRLNADASRRRWIVRGGSRRRILKQQHFDYLTAVYLPKHRGWKWDEQRGLYL